MVKDINNHAPQFTSQTYNGYIYENDQIVDTHLKAIAATDKDSPKISPIRYSLIDHPDSIQRITDYFVIDPKSAQITVKHHPLDVESLVSHKFLGTLIVTDSGGLKDTASLNIIVFDVNDHEPMFKKSSYYIELSEELELESVIFQAKATDLDRISHLSYRIIDAEISPNTDFEINPETGLIFLKKSLDFETRPEYLLNLQVSDGKFFDETKLFITVVDINDASPKWLPNQKTEFEISENTKTETFIYKFTATDPDTHSNLKYKVLSTEPVIASNWFILNSETGILETASNQIDREVTNQVTLHIAAIDLAGINPQVEQITDHLRVTSG